MTVPPKTIRGWRSRLSLATRNLIATRLFISASNVLSASEKARHAIAHTGSLDTHPYRVACFSPYATWDIVSSWELTVLRALVRRGAHIQLLLCDAVSPLCDLAWADKDPPWDRCLVCQNRATQAARLHQQPFEWVSRYVDLVDRERAIGWAASLVGDELRTARLGDSAVGEWCLSSVYSHFQASHLDMSDRKVQDVYRQYITGAAITLAGCQKWLEETKPDVLWLFNGRLSLTRVALEVARGLGIRVICHERGMVRRSLRLWENERCSQYNRRREFALNHSARPLTEDQAIETLQWFLDRRASRNWNRQPFLKKAKSSKKATLAAAGLSPGDWFLLVLTSSDNEFAAEASRNQIYPEQYSWLAAVLSWAAKHPTRRVVIRFHPNTGPNSWEYMRSRLQIPDSSSDRRSPIHNIANVCIVPPANTLDTYALIDSCAAATTYGTTAGIETAILGKTVIAADQCLYYGLPWVKSATSQSHFLELLDQSVDSDQSRCDFQIARGSLRFMWDYHLAPSIQSNLVHHPGIDYARVNYRFNNTNALAYGNDPGLDRLTDVLLGQRPIYDPRPEVIAIGEQRVLHAHLNSMGLAP